MKKQDSKQRLFEVMSRLDKTFKPKLNEYHDGDPEGHQEPYHSFNPDEHPKYSSNNNEYTPSNRGGYTNNIPNNKIEDFFNLNIRDSQQYSGIDDISFDEMKDEVLSAMDSFGVSNLHDLQNKFNELNEEESNQPELNTPNESKLKEVIKKIQNDLNIPDWNSPEGIQKRKELAQTMASSYEQMTNTLNSTIENREKARRIQGLLKGTGILATIIGIGQLIFSSTVDFSLRQGLEVDLSGGNMLRIALFLLIVKIIHAVLSKGTLIMQDIQSGWNYIKNLFKSDKNINEEFNVMGYFQ